MQTTASAPYIKNKETFKIGDKVHYTANEVHYNGIIKYSPAPDSFTKEDTSICHIVFNCDGNWDDYQNYTGVITNIKDLKPDWKNNEKKILKLRLKF